MLVSQVISTQSFYDAQILINCHSSNVNLDLFYATATLKGLLILFNYMTTV